jgi:hypothetical protein
MFRSPKEEGYEVVAITLAALLIFSTLFLTENRATRERSVPPALEEPGSITESTNALSEDSGIPSDTIKEVSSTVPKLNVADIVTTTARSDGSTTIPVTTFPIIPEDINSEKVLDDLQIDACVAADDSGVCRTKLYGLGIVDIDDCCKYLGRCCA